jgi:CHAT domain-containing protein/predicted negative regulator of RcsB-dependent stress response
VWSGCRAQPDRSFAEAERLRVRYEKKASQLAIQKYQEALARWKHEGKTADAVRASQQMAGTYEQLGLLQQSLRSYLEAFALSTGLHDGLLQSRIQTDVGLAHARLGHFDSALTECHTALELARSAQGQREEARALYCLGEAEYDRGNKRKALAFYEEAEPLWVTLGDPGGYAETLLSLGSTQADLTELDPARASLTHALSLWTELGDQRGIAVTGLALTRLPGYFQGDYQEALNRLGGWRDHFRDAGDTVWEAACLSNIGHIYEEMAESGNALRYWEEAYRLFEDAGLQMASLEMVIDIGATYLATDVTNALKWFEKALVLSTASGNQQMQAWAYRYIGTARLVRGDPTQGLQSLQKSLDILGSIDDPRFRARTLAEAGTAYLRLGDQRRAKESFERALEQSRASSDRVGQAQALFGLAQAAAAANALDTARVYVEAALKLAESSRTKVENRDLRTSYLASVHQYYELYIDVLMRLDKVHPGRRLMRAAFEVSERARARSLLDGLAGAKIDPRNGIAPELLKRAEALQKAFDVWAERQSRQGVSTPTVTARSLAREYEELEDRYNQLQAEMRSTSPHYGALVEPQPLGLEAVQKEALDDETLLLEYSLGEKRSYLWAVSNRDAVSYQLPSRAELEKAVQRTYEQLTARMAVVGDQADRAVRIDRADAAYWVAAADLSEILLGPVADQMSRRRVVVATDGALQYLPFAALPMPRQRGEPLPVVVNHEVVSLPSASALAVLRRETRSRKLAAKAVAVLADPVFDSLDPRLGAASMAPTGTQSSRDRSQVNPEWSRAVGTLVGLTESNPLTIPRLPSTRQEADAIVAAAPQGTAFEATGFHANRATAMSRDLAQYRILHFATHGVFNNEDPASSGIILSMFDERGRRQNGFLRLHEIYGLDLPVELVVLSACDTALGRAVQGEGLVGIVRGFMYAGAKRVVASLWKVDDRATVELMTRFYSEMLKQNQSPAAALRHAQLFMWQQNKWRAPFYWAAFVLQGEW